MRRECAVAFFVSVVALAQAGGESNLLRYTITAEPFQIELTLPDGSRRQQPLPRRPHYFAHRANLRWPFPDWPDAMRGQVVTGQVL